MTIDLSGEAVEKAALLKIAGNTFILSMVCESPSVLVLNVGVLFNAGGNLI